MVLSVALIMPLFASAQTDNTALSGQVQSLWTQIQSLQQQLHTLLQTEGSSSTLPQGDGSGDVSGVSAWMQGSATSTPGSVGGNVQGPRMNVCPEITRDLRMGARGSDVSDLQSMLADNGLLSASSTTGFFGPLTARALGKFQVQFGITSSSTGFMGPLTRAFIGNHCNPKGGMGGEGSTTMPMMRLNPASSTLMGIHSHPMIPVGSSTQPVDGAWNNGSSHGLGGPNMRDYMMMGSTTPPRPCPMNAGTAAPGAISNMMPPPCPTLATSTSQIN